MDSYGDFVVVWSGDGTQVVRSDGTIVNLGDDSGIFAQVYDKNGKAVGDAFLVNQTTVGIQNSRPWRWTPTATSSSLGPATASRAIRTAASMPAASMCKAAAMTDEMLVNTTTANRQDNSDVAMDANGDFVVVWQSDQQDGNTSGIFGQRFSAAGAKLGGEMPINTYTLDKQIDPAVCDGRRRRFRGRLVELRPRRQRLRRLCPAVQLRPASPRTRQEFLVNQTTLNWQITPDVAMASNGQFVITWSAFGQDNITVSQPTYDYGIYARIYNANGSDYKNAATGAAMGEFRINATTAGDQMDSAVAIVRQWQNRDGLDRAGDVLGDGLYHRRDNDRERRADSLEGDGSGFRDLVLYQQPRPDHQQRGHVAGNRQDQLERR